MTIYLGLLLLIGITGILVAGTLVTRHKLKSSALAENLSADNCLNCKTCLCWSCMPADQPGAEVFSVNKK